MVQQQEQIPIIDMNEVDDGLRRREIIEAIRSASEEWGFFQVVNHGIPEKIMEEIMSGTARFHQGEEMIKLGLASRDIMKKVQFQRNVKSVVTQKQHIWKDTLKIEMAPDPPLPNEIPASCRDIMFAYAEHVRDLGETLLRVISEGIGLGPQHLMNLGCADGMRLLAHYYPPCTRLEMSVATTQHTDPSFLTILLQDEVGGLQILHNHSWIDVHPVHGALVVNIGDLLQLITNDKLKSVVHRVLRNRAHARQSVACILGNYRCNTKYGPIKELINGNTRPLYQETTAGEYLIHFLTHVVDHTAALNDFKL